MTKPIHKTRLTSSEFYSNNEQLYNLLSDYVFNHRNAPIEGADPVVYVDIELNDCYLLDGSFYMPCAYSFEREPLYMGYPTLTKLEVQNMLASVEQPELNDKARLI